MKDNIKKGCNIIGYKGVDWIHLSRAQVFVTETLDVITIQLNFSSILYKLFL